MAEAHERMADFIVRTCSLPVEEAEKNYNAAISYSSELDCDNEEKLSLLYNKLSRFEATYDIVKKNRKNLGKMGAKIYPQSRQINEEFEKLEFVDGDINYD